MKNRLFAKQICIANFQKIKFDNFFKFNLNYSILLQVINNNIIKTPKFRSLFKVVSQK